MTIKRSMSAQDERPLKRVDKKNRPKKEIDTGKEKGITLETPKTEEQKVSVKKEGDGAEAPKKKKNIIRVYHAQNASDGGKNRKKPAGEKKARPQGARPAAQAGTPAKAEAPAKPVAQTSAPKAEQPVKAQSAPAKTEAPKAAAQASAPKAEQPAKTQNAQPAKAQNEASAKPAGQQNRNENGSRQGGQNSDNRNGQQGGRGFRQGENRDNNRDNRGGNGGRFGQGRSQGGQGQFRGNRNGDGQGRPARQGDSQNRGPRQGDGNGRNFRQGDNRDNRNGNGGRFGQGRPQGGQGRFGGKDEGRSEGRFGGQNHQGGQRSGGARRSGGSDAIFTPELTKTSKDSKRERDRENKNKKKDFDKTSGGGHRPNQGGRNQMSRIPKALQKPAPQPKQEEKKPEIKEITIPEKLTIRELAEAMKMQPSAIVKKLFMEGQMVTVNHEIDFEQAEEIALGFDIIAEKEEKVDVIEELLKEEEEDESTMVSRPPVVCVMGHVDHGKTSLLDAIRKTNVTRGEAGGITQHIGAYVVDINGQKITFLDTPGHEAFTAMRMRGANSTDIAVLVVAADDGVMPQTVEAISHAKAAGVEIIVAINKIDKPSANIERVKQELSEYELIPEDWGGTTPFVPVSAKTGEGIDDLLEMILLTAEVSELKANPNRAARGLVIEAQLDKGKGPVATILVQKGTLHVGDFIAAGACSGKVRAMMDDKGRRVKQAGPSTPVEILGLGDVPNAGEVLMSFENDKEAKNFAAAFVSENKNRLLEETKGKLSLDNLFDQIQASDLKELPIIVKADVQGSVEAVKQSLVKLSNEEVVVRVIHGGVGAINESDVSLAATSNAIIIGFNVRPDTTAKQLAEQEGVDLRLYKVIYQAIEDVEAAMKGMLDPVFEEKVIGHAEVRQLFKASGVGTIAGSYVLDGTFQRGCKVRISRGEDQIYEGELASLKRFKDDVKEVRAGYECGLVFQDFNDVKEEDKVEAYIMVEVPR
ncbi:translation initiation factor IF-2 [Blautia segnis]|uniref:Translation initiation factor IF-2 n=1 Tax=Blautia segnis TaxID=2763030 RepID=A0A8I0DMM3_9FIRM|nr:translation initiation factor IF-2 [Blautia segnis]MBC5649639.1 translation initiation factor IF-2 [Blautia segnis]MEE0301936.1 translation initiation factor IF-2 [Blautia sp.]HCL09930.1 translation initiation factor IF-2 [Blautia sp.]